MYEYDGDHEHDQDGGYLCKTDWYDVYYYGIGDAFMDINRIVSIDLVYYMSLCNLRIFGFIGRS